MSQLQCLRSPVSFSVFQIGRVKCIQMVVGVVLLGGYRPYPYHILYYPFRALINNIFNNQLNTQYVYNYYLY